MTFVSALSTNETVPSPPWLVVEGGVCRVSLIFKCAFIVQSDFCATIHEIFCVFQASAVDVPEEEKFTTQDPNQPEESTFAGLLLGGFEQDQRFQEALRGWRADGAGGLERPAQAALSTPGSPGRWRHSRQALRDMKEVQAPAAGEQSHMVLLMWP